MGAVQCPPASSPAANNRAQSGLDAGAVIGRKWLLLDRVGRGAFGDIFVAECIAQGDASYGKRVALKVEKLEIADEATVKAALEAEQRQKDRDRERAAAQGRSTSDAPAPHQLVPPSSPSPLTPAPQSSSGSLPLPSAGLPQPSEPLSPQSPYPPSSPSPVDGGRSSGAVPPSPTSPPVYMKRCIVKLEAVVLSKLQACSSFPRFVEYGRDGPLQVAYLGMQLLGDNLLRLRRQQRKLRFSLSTVLRFGLAALRCIEAMHSAGFIHRDVKPSNFVIGLGAESGRVFMIDFGLARAYREKGSLAVLPARKEIGGFRGTPRYASIFVHREEDLGRRDDLWSLLYILVEFVTGDLPWGAKRDKAAIGAIKERYHSAKLLKGCPSCFAAFFQHLAGLAFDSAPDYALLAGLLEGKLRKLKVRPDELMDWEDSAAKAAALTALAEQAVARPLPFGKYEEEKRADEQRMVIVLHPHAQGTAAVEVRPHLAPKTPPPQRDEEEKEEDSVRLQSAGDLGGRQLSASVSLSYSPSYSAQPLSSRNDEAQPASPAVSLCATRGSLSTLSVVGGRGSLPALRDEQHGPSGGKGGGGASGELVAMYEVGTRPVLQLELHDSQLNLRRKQQKALGSARGSDSRNAGVAQGTEDDEAAERAATPTESTAS